MRISKEYLTLLKNSNAQLQQAAAQFQAAQANHAFVVRSLMQEYKLTAADSVDQETGEITKVKDAKASRKRVR